MDILDILNEEFSDCNWDLEKIGAHQYKLLCNGEYTKYKYFNFNKMFIPSLDSHTKQRMERENIKAIIENIKKEKINDRE